MPLQELLSSLSGNIVQDSSVPVEGCSSQSFESEGIEVRTDSKRKWRRCVCMM